MPLSIQSNQVRQIANLMSAAVVLEGTREMAEHVAEAIIGEEQVGGEFGSGPGSSLLRVF